MTADTDRTHGAAAAGAPSYERARELARDPDPATRRALAARTDTPPEILYFLAEDADTAVRRAVAGNPQTPRKADLLLTGDGEDSIRADLAAKIARLTPDVPEDARSTLYALTVQALETLAEDNLVRVRRLLTETLKDVASAPPSVVRILAHDPELSIAEPVLEFSPVLSETDLLEIIRGGPIQGALSAISRRRGLSDRLSDAIVDSGDTEAVAALLTNESAQIREETLDVIVDRAPEIERWHEPLVMRPQLSPKAARRITNFVAMHLLDKLQRRVDLDDETLAAVAEAVEARIEHENRPQEDPAWASNDDLAERVAEMQARGTLDAEAIEAALSRGEQRFVILALAALAGLARETVADIANQRSAKGMVAVAWTAGLTPHIAVRLQSQLARIPPGGILKADGDDWPLSESDMAWQATFFADGRQSG